MANMLFVRVARLPKLSRLETNELNQKAFSFSLRDNGKIASIYLFIPGVREDDVSWKQSRYLMLDGTLREYDVETRIGLIKMLSPDTRTDGDRYPLAELPARFDRLVAHLEGRSERLSQPLDRHIPVFRYS